MTTPNEKNITIPPGPYRLDRDVKNPKPDRRRTRDWRASVTWRAGWTFVVIAQTRVVITSEMVADLPPEALAAIEAKNMYTVVELAGEHYACLRRVGPGAAEQYAALAEALVPCEESVDQFMTRLACDNRFAAWLVERGTFTRPVFESLWESYQAGDE